MVNFKYNNTLTDKTKESLAALVTTAIGTYSDDDLEKHEAISSLTVKDKKKKGKIIEEIEAGYILADKIIRYPKVIIGK